MLIDSVTSSFTLSTGLASTPSRPASTAPPPTLSSTRRCSPSRLARRSASEPNRSSTKTMTAIGRFCKTRENTTTGGVRLPPRPLPNIQTMMTTMVAAPILTIPLMSLPRRQRGSYTMTWLTVMKKNKEEEEREMRA